jgi:excinuclease ABC subunit C
MSTVDDLWEQLKRKVALFSDSPGVYIMRDNDNQVLYVGKALNLQSRVRSYLGAGDGRLQIPRLMEKVADIEPILCENEAQALILERDLIKLHKPRYNIRLKDDKSYLSIRVDTQAEWPRLESVRRPVQDGALYFGPFVSGYQLREILDVIKKVLPLRTCPDTVFSNRQRPCLEYQIKRCSGPCCIPVNKEEYFNWLQQAQELLQGNVDKIIETLSVQMEDASQELLFEQAATLRDRIEILKSFAEGHKNVFHAGVSRDAIALYRDESRAVVSITSSRFGRIASNKNFSFEQVWIADNELLEQVIIQYYQGKADIPEEVFTQVEIVSSQTCQELFSNQVGHPVKIQVPEQGSSFRLVELAKLNAQQHFVTVYDSELRYSQVAQEIVALASLAQTPRRIECIDISNLGGTEIVGALVCFFDGVPLKSGYRKYKIGSRVTDSNQALRKGKQDDFSSIYEVCLRRIRAGLETGELPDLLIIDGGKGQLNAALAAKKEFSVELDIISLAKIREYSSGMAPERIFLPEKERPIPLKPGKDVTLFMQRIRDEVHRFAITFHRHRREKGALSSSIDEIPGIGLERKRRLLSYFKSVEAIVSADNSEVARIGRMPLKLAEKLKRIVSQGTID